MKINFNYTFEKVPKTTEVETKKGKMQQTGYTSELFMENIKLGLLQYSWNGKIDISEYTFDKNARNGALSFSYIFENSKKPEYVSESGYAELFGSVLECYTEAKFE